MYPNIRWDQVHFYRDLPWFMQDSFAIATALPATYHHRRIHVHCQNYGPKDPHSLLSLVHEAYHIQQYEDLGRGWGLGFFRGFTVYYLGAFLASFWKALRNGGFQKVFYRAYISHPMERTAYAQEANFKLWQSDLARLGPQRFLEYHSHLRVRQSPTVPLAWPWKMLGAIAAVLIALAKPLVEGLLWIGLLPWWWLRK